MFRSLRNTVFGVSKNINGNYHTRTHSLCCLQDPAFLIIRSISSSPPANHTSSSSSFVISYLMNSCGLSEDKALSTSKKLHFKTSSGPDSVLTLLETHGFTKPYLSKLICGCPVILLFDAHKTLEPKLQFFNSVGISGLHLAKILSTSPGVLGRSLQNHIIPTYAFLKSILHSDTNVIAALKRSSKVLSEDPGRHMVPNIRVLHDQGVPESNIIKFLKMDPRIIQINAVRFKEIVDDIKGMGFNPSQRMFLLAVRALTSISKTSREAKLNVFRSWGWSEDEIQMAFRNQPHSVMMTSEKKIMAVMDFLVNKMGYSPLVIAECPNILGYSLETRIIPRCSIIRILVSKGLVKKAVNIKTVLPMAEKSFLDKYVIKYKQEAPELLKEYQGQLDGLK